ncbi:MAG: hypothetical protein ABIA04_02935 [Pseudomonadota bacterium]
MGKCIISKVYFFNFISISIILFSFLLGCTATNSNSGVQTSANYLDSIDGVLDASQENYANLNISAKFSLAADVSIDDLAPVITIEDITGAELRGIADSYTMTNNGDGDFSIAEVAIEKGKEILVTISVTYNEITYSTSEQKVIDADDNISFELIIGKEGSTCGDIVVAEVLSTYSYTENANERKLTVYIKDITTGEYIDPSQYTISLDYTDGNGTLSEDISITTSSNAIEHTFSIVTDESSGYSHEFSLEDSCSKIVLPEISSDFAKDASVTIDGEVVIFSIAAEVTSSSFEANTDETTNVSFNVELTSTNESSTTDISDLLTYSLLESAIKARSRVVTSSSSTISITTAEIASFITNFAITQDTTNANEFTISFDFTDDITSIALIVFAQASPTGQDADSVATADCHYSQALEMIDTISFNIPFVDSQGDSLYDPAIAFLSGAWASSDNYSPEVTLATYDSSGSKISDLGSCNVSSAGLCFMTVSYDSITECLEMEDSSHARTCFVEFHHEFNSNDHSLDLYDFLLANESISPATEEDNAVQIKNAITGYLDNNMNITIENLTATLSDLIINTEVIFSFTAMFNGTSPLADTDISVIGDINGTTAVDFSTSITTNASGYGEWRINAYWLKLYIELGMTFEFVYGTASQDLVTELSTDWLTGTSYEDTYSGLAEFIELELIDNRCTDEFELDLGAIDFYVTVEPA